MSAVRPQRGFRTHAAHFGAFRARFDGHLEVVPHPDDPEPPAMLANVRDIADPRYRVLQPHIRKGWLENGPGPDDRRGSDDYVPISWEQALDATAGEIARICDTHGAGSLFAGSYGWASAGRFHHAQGQVHRFFNCYRGYVRSVNSYSAGAAEVLMPHIVGASPYVNSRSAATWREMAETSELVVAFGGMALKNSVISPGGTSRHIARGSIRRAAERGCGFVLISPLRDDLPPEAHAQWLAPRPLTDAALILALCETLRAEGLADRAFLDRYTAGYERFAAYLSGETDGRRKDAEWASAICGIDAAAIRDLARRMASKRTLVVASHSLQRAEHGEQPVWAALALACMLGGIGLPGAGFIYSFGAMANGGKPPLDVPLPTFPQGRNAVDDFIPVARISDMLLDPGGTYAYNGERRTYPDIRMVYWAGGNPFHHQQDLKRLARAFARPETIVVNEPFWTAAARHADIVLPATTTLERDDIGAAANDPYLIPMQAVLPPVGEARSDYAIFSALAGRLGIAERFCEGRSEDEWLRALYETTRAAIAAKGMPAPDFDAFWEMQELPLPVSGRPDPLAAFRADPTGAALATKSGRIELFCETIAGFGLPDCPGHPAWVEPEEWLGGKAAEEWPLQLVANQPANKLHSQLDFAAHSRLEKSGDRAVLAMHPDDAAARGLRDGDTVIVRSPRGACLAVAAPTPGIRRHVVKMPTGAWYRPRTIGGETVCVAGNPNVLTRDAGTSALAQGSTGQLCLVEVEKWTDGEVPL